MRRAHTTRGGHCDGPDYLTVLGALQRGVVAEHEIASDVLAFLNLPIAASKGG